MWRMGRNTMDGYEGKLMKQKQIGMTLIEILIVVLVVSVGMAATAKFQGELLQAGATTKARTQALAFVQNEVETLRINHSTAASGSLDDVVGGNATYDVIWSVSPVAGLANTDQYTATVTWN
ncbi:MAG: prepilin-type N-terminal cleavage/methylation domain-containing protein, partial [Oceanospirillum sp.]|nr:prepilin-type N-terminal cleavage/methylation domain-containing protein [Oceanospirillum sp.]